MFSWKFHPTNNNKRKGPRENSTRISLLPRDYVILQEISCVPNEGGGFHLYIRFVFPAVILKFQENRFFFILAKTVRIYRLAAATMSTNRFVSSFYGYFRMFAAILYRNVFGNRLTKFPASNDIIINTHIRSIERVEYITSLFIHCRSADRFAQQQHQPSPRSIVRFPFRSRRIIPGSVVRS